MPVARTMERISRMSPLTIGIERTEAMAMLLQVSKDLVSLDLRLTGVRCRKVGFFWKIKDEETARLERGEQALGNRERLHRMLQTIQTHDGRIGLLSQILVSIDRDDIPQRGGERFADERQCLRRDICNVEGSEPFHCQIVHQHAGPAAIIEHRSIAVDAR